MVKIHTYPFHTINRKPTTKCTFFLKQRCRHPLITKKIISGITKGRCCHLDAPLLWGPCSTGLGGSERARLCPGGGGGALFLDKVELPPTLD